MISIGLLIAVGSASAVVQHAALQGPACYPKPRVSWPPRLCEPSPFDAWLSEHGAVRDGVTIEVLPSCGRGLAARRNIEEGELLVSIPGKLVLCGSAYLGELSQMGPVGAQVSEAFAPLLQTPEGQSTVLALALLHEVALGERSRFAPFVSTLPPSDDLGIPLLWTEEYTESLLRGSHLTKRAARLRGDLSAEFMGLEQDVFVHERTAFPKDVFSVDRYLWAHALILSRALPVSEELALIPILELSNHDPRSKHTVTFSEASGVVAMIAGGSIGEGEPICIDYAAGMSPPTWQFFFDYGFVPDPPTVRSSQRVPGPADDDDEGDEGEASVAVWLESGACPMQARALQPSDPLLMQKKALLVALGADEDVEEGVELDLRSSAPTAPAAVLRLGHVSEQTAPEVAALIGSWKAEPQDLWTRLQRPVNDAVERLVARQLVDLCEETLLKLPPSMPMAMAATSTPTSETQRREQSAARVLLGERHAIEACRDHWLPLA
jgi:hypothetical protein